jgi:hypothetical protein
MLCLDLKLPAPAHCRRAIALTTALVPLLVACDNVVVAPAEVAAVRVVPEEAQVSIGETITLTAEAQDPEGRALRGIAVQWASDEPGIASVDGNGQVLGGGSGTTTIRARVGSLEGAAQVRVLAPATIGLSHTSAAFAVDSGGPSPPALQVEITNSGEEALTGLALAVSYSAGGSGWLSATLSRTTAPATMTVSVSPGSLRPGDYRATVQVSAASAPGDGVAFPVTLQVREVAPPPAQLPQPPANLRIENQDTGEVVLAWTPQGTGASEFRLERRTGDGSFQALATVGGSTTTYADRTIQPDSHYTFRVRACNDAGCSGYSNQVSTTTTPAAPTNLRAEQVQRNRVRIAWNNNSPTQPVFRVERAEGDGQFVLIDTTEEGITRYDDRSVAASRTYRYRVTACNPGGCSAPSNTLTVTTPG